MPRGRSTVRIDQELPQPFAVYLLRLFFRFRRGIPHPIQGKAKTMSLNKKRAAVAAVLVLLLAVGATTLPGGRGGDARAEGKGTWQDLVFLYTTDIKGKIEPCG